MGDVVAVDDPVGLVESVEETVGKEEVAAPLSVEVEVIIDNPGPKITSSIL